LGHTWYLRGEFDRSRQALEEGRRRYLERGSPWAAAFALSKLGLALEGSLAFDQAMECQRQALEIFRGYGDRVGQAYSLSRMSVDAYGLGQYDRSVELAEQGFEIFRAFGHRWGILASRCRLGFAYLGKGDVARSREELVQALQGALAHKLVPLCLYALLGLASCFAQEGELERAGELLGYVRSYPEEITLYLDLAKRWLAGVEPVLTPAAPDKLEELAASLFTARLARKTV
jgi:tetratricopeptide (TPR) repeat protein